MSRAEIQTSAGAVRGVEDGGVGVFKGIPYAADTSGEGRFRPPRPPRPWAEVRDCSEYGPACPQMTVEQMLGVTLPPGSEAFMGTRTHEPEMSEDCLVLNVWTPAADATAALPVLLWLHGGGWSTGSASWPLYDFTNLSRNGDVVVVGINHRVGILGFLDLSHLGDEFADSGNVGMLDVVAALAWVRDNISGFGGDPHNVTVFGESGGGAKVSALLGMPAAQGLFHKAIAMSGAMLSAQLPEQAKASTDAVVELLGLGDNAEKLATVEADRLVDAEINLPGRGVASTLSRGGRGFRPVLGPSLPRHPVDALRDGLASGVTLVSGCNRDETIGFLFNDPDLWTLGIESAVNKLRPLLGDDAETVVAAYQAAQPDDSPTSLLIGISTDAMFRLPQIRLAEAHVEGGGAATYMYLFTFGHTDPNGSVRAPHGTDMPYFFDNVDKAPVAAGPHADELVSLMSGSIVALAHSGEPGRPASTDWPQYTLDRRATKRMDLSGPVDDDPFGATRECWNGRYLPGLGGA